MPDAGIKSEVKRSPRRKRLGRANPWAVQIEVYLIDVGPPPQFNIVTILPTKGNGHNPPIKFQNNQHPGFKITFKLYDQTNGGLGSGYRFASNPSDAVWSKLGPIGPATCPTTAASEVFSNPKLMDPTTLQVLNRNPDLGGGKGQGDFMYTLNVSITGSRPYVPLDPGGQNMNGSS